MIGDQEGTKWNAHFYKESKREENIKERKLGEMQG